MKAIFRVINRSDNMLQQYRNPTDIATFLCGRRIDNYMIIKSDDQGDRLIALESGNIDAIKHQLSIA